MPARAFVVWGTPVPQGSLSYKGHRKGKPVLVSDNDGLAPWRRTIAHTVSEELGDDWEPLDEPVRVGVEFQLPRPKRPRFDVPATKPDLDKLIRAVLDALATAGVYANDSRVYEFGPILSRYAAEPGAEGAVIVVEWGDALESTGRS